MAGINYKHLRYFWMVAKSGSIARASERLHLTPQSISGQLGEFESALGHKLLRRAGRGLELTEAGQRALGYAEQIFALGDELLEGLREDAGPQAVPFRVGIADSVPKSLAYRMVEPSLSLDQSIRLVCREGQLTGLLGELALHRLDMVIADRPLPGGLNVRSHAHFLGESGVSVFGARTLAGKARQAFPGLLDGAPFLMPGADVALQPRLQRWFEAEKLRPRIVGEFDDSALLKAFGEGGAGFFVGPTSIEKDIVRQYRVQPVGRIEAVREQIFAITNERKLTHPVVAAICRLAQEHMEAAVPPAKRLQSKRA